MSTPICPECEAGKHQNCDGNAWDFDADELTACTCRSRYPHVLVVRPTHRNPGGCTGLPTGRRKMLQLVGRVWKCPRCPRRYIALDGPLRWEKLLTDRQVAALEAELGIR